MQVFGYMRVPLVINGVDGKDGKDGTDGKDAVFYSMEASASALTYYPGRKEYSPESVTFSGYKTEGSDTAAIEADTWWYVEQVSAGGAAKEVWAQGSSVEVVPEVTDFVARLIIVTMCREQSISSAYDGCRKTVSVNTYCQPRTLVWEDQADGFQFECGEVGDTYIDTVIYGGDGTANVQKNMFRCIKTHQKSADNAPPASETQNDYWLGVTWYDTVAMNLLLANYAYIKNLVADDVYMETEDGKTAIWINPSLAGMLVRKMDSAYTKGRENQTAEDWENPTTAFTAQELPSLESLYSVKEFSGEKEDGYLTGFINDSDYDSVYSGLSLIGSVNLTGVLEAGSTVRMSVECDIRVTIEEGSSTNYDFSQIHFELRCASSVAGLTTEGEYRVLWTWDAKGSGVNGETVTRTKNETTDITFVTDSEDLYVRLYDTSFVELARSNMTVEGSFKVSGYCAKSKFLSRYTGGGAFVGISLQDYFRVGMNSEGEAQHTFLAGGNGIDLTINGCFQYKGGNKLPMGYALLVGEFTPNVGTVSGSYWTFDDATLDSMEFKDVGCYSLTLPSLWNTEHGFDLATHGGLSVQASVQGDTGAYAVTEIEDGVISVYTYGADGSPVGVPFSLRVDYFPLSKTVVAKQPVQYTEPTVSLGSGLYWETTGSSSYKVYFNAGYTSAGDSSETHPSYFEINGTKYYVEEETATNRDSSGSEVTTRYVVDVPTSAQSGWSSPLMFTYVINKDGNVINGEVATTNRLVWTGSQFQIR